MLNDLVSIIIPCHNSAAFIKRSFESALCQTYSNKEIILVDNNSSDNTYEILRTFQAQYPLLIKVKRELRPGAASARNSGLAEAKGEWIQFLDSDDELLPEKIHRQLQTTYKNEADLCVGGYFYIRPNRTESMSPQPNPWIGLITSKLGITSANLWRRSKIEEVGGFNEKWGSSEEYVLLFDLLKAGAKVCYYNNPETNVFFQPESVGKSENPYRSHIIWNNIFQLRLEIRDFLIRTNQYSDYIKKEWEKYMYSHLIYRKYKNPEVYSIYMSELRFDLPIYFRFLPILKREFKRVYSLINV